MSYPKMLAILLFIVSPFLFAGGCNLFEDEQVVDTTGTIFGSWELVEIQYDNGETITPQADEQYWFELLEDSVFSEGSYHYSLRGQNNCNTCFGYFDFDKKNQNINISFICNRTICGISSRFSLTVATSYKYSFHNDLFILFFNSPTNGRGTLKLKNTINPNK